MRRVNSRRVNLIIMTEIETKIRNFKLIKSLNTKMKSGHVYLVSGGNGTGKTTFTQAVEGLLSAKLPKDSLSHNAPGGLIDGVITNKDGDTYRVSIDLKKGKPPSFSIVKPDLSVSKKKTDLQHIFNYQNVQPEVFMALGATEAGRRNQAEMLTSLMTLEIRKELNSLDATIQSNYDDRRDVGVLIKNKPTKIVPTEEDEKIAVNAEKWKLDFNKRVETYNDAKKQLDHYTSTKDTLIENKTDTQLRISKLKKDLELEENILTQVNEKIKINNDTNMEQEAIDKLKSDLEADQEAVQVAVKALETVTEYKEFSNEIANLTDKYEKHSDIINNSRQLRKDLIAENIPIENMMIDDGQLYYIEGEEAFPFNESALSYARGVLTVAKMILYMNPEIPIVCVGKSAELDNKSINELKDLAKERDAIVVLDYVTQDQQPLSINVIEETE